MKDHHYQLYADAAKLQPHRAARCWCCGEVRDETENTIDPDIRVCCECWKQIKRASLSAFASIGRALAKYNSY
jgi:hypothetical protein